MINKTKNTITKYKFYVGWDNKTHKREIKKAINVLNDFKVLGFNINKNMVGFWEKTKENSFIIEVLNTEEINLNDNIIKNIRFELENKLNQFLVLTTKEEIQII